MEKKNDGTRHGTLCQCKNCGVDLIVTHDEEGNRQIAPFLSAKCKVGKQHEPATGVHVMVIS